MSSDHLTPFSLTCQRCNKQFSAFPCDIKRGRKYCSWSCFSAKAPSFLNGTCEFCGKAYHISPSHVALKRRFCSKQCKDDGLEKDEVAEFKARLGSPTASGCIPWTGTLDSRGYGVFKANNKRCVASRFAYSLHYGPIPDGLRICHKCDNPTCCNPEHLFAGTAMDNSRDMVAKGRACDGEKQWGAKLTEEIVVEMRNLWRAGKLTQREIGEKFGVAQTVAGRAIKGISWKYVPDPCVPSGKKGTRRRRQASP